MNDSVVRNVTAIGSYSGFCLLSDSSNNLVSGITAHGNSYAGIFVYTSVFPISPFNNTFSDLLAFNNTLYGLYLLTTYSTNVTNLTAYNNYAGVYVWGQNTSFPLSDSISRSIIYNNTYGAILNRTNDTLFYDNVFNNTVNAYPFNSTIAGWNAALSAGANIINGPMIGGNYWGAPDGTGFSDVCADANADGICDSPYAIDENNSDLYPLANPFAGVPGAPAIFISSPLNSTYNSSSADLNFSAGNAAISACWYSLDGAANVSLPGCANTSIPFSNGPHTLQVYANDTSNNVNSSSVSFASDSAAPLLDAQAPSNSLYNYSSIGLNFTATDSGSGVSSCWYSLDSAANVSLSGCSNTTLIVSDGSHTLELYANDSAGNLNSTSVSFIVDSTAPTVGIQSPANTTYTNSSVQLEFTATDLGTGISSCRYSLDGAPEVALPGCSNTTLSLPNGAHSISISAQDTAGSTSTSSVSFTVNFVSTTIHLVVRNKDLMPITLTGAVLDGYAYPFSPALQFAPAGSLIVSVSLPYAMCDYKGQIVQITNVTLIYTRGQVAGLAQSSPVPLVMRCS